MANGGHAAKEAYGNAAENAVQPPNAMVFLQLQYLAPGENQPRNFPPQFPVTVRWGEDVEPPGANTHEETYQTTADGKLQFPAQPVADKPWRRFTLRFQATANQPRYIYVEKRADPQQPGFTTDDPNVIRQETPNRFFSVPERWNLKQSDWNLGNTGFAGNGQYTKATGAIEHTAFGAGGNPNAPRDIGSAATPVQFVLNPHWKYHRFEFFDRYYGPTFGDPARDGHGQRISIPPIALEGFRNNTDPALAEVPGSRSNWTVGADEQNLLQCLPWILRNDATGAALLALTGANMGLRFLTTQEADKQTYIVSQSKTAQELQHLKADSPPASPPGPERLKAYDLPRVWKSKNYFTRETPASPSGPGQFFNNLDAAAMNRADTQNTPLIFCLDDIVLANDAYRQVPLPPDDRVAVFWHTFSDRFVLQSPPGAAVADFSRLGVYKPGADGHWNGYPYSDIQMPVRYYITNYPDWTRLVAAQGNLWDAFSVRMPEGNDVVGARAAVRWTGITSPPNAVGIGTVNAAPPARTDKPFFSVQPYWRCEFINHSDNPQAAAIDQDEWAAGYAPGSPYYIGRFDLAHLRCTDWHGNDEVTTLMRYLRYAFDLAGVTANPPVAGPPLARPEDWAKEAVDTVTARWNALDAFNPTRPLITPSPPQAAPPPLKAQIVTFLQYLSPPVSHFRIRTVAPGAQSFMAGDGDAQWRVNAIRHDPGAAPPVPQDDWGSNRWRFPGRGLAAAHETGHGGTMPDEYPYSDPEECSSYKFLHMPANPYQRDHSAAHSCLMRNNGYIRTRYFWHAAEWLHSLPNLGGTDWRLEHGRYRSFALPHYQHAAANGARNYYSWPVRFNLRNRAAGQHYLFDSFLFFVGEEEYTQSVLAGTPDGMLEILIRMMFNLDVVAGADRTDVSAGLYDQVLLRLNAWLNVGHHADFQVHPNPRRKPDFHRCELHFTPCVNLRGAVSFNLDGSVRSRWDWLDGDSPHHLLVEFVNAAALAPLNTAWTANAPGASNRLRINWNQAAWGGMAGPAQNAWLVQAGDAIAARCVGTLGLSTGVGAATDYRQAASYRHIVRTVMDNAAPNPNLF